MLFRSPGRDSDLQHTHAIGAPDNTCDHICLTGTRFRSGLQPNRAVTARENVVTIDDYLRNARIILSTTSAYLQSITTIIQVPCGNPAWKREGLVKSNTALEGTSPAGRQGVRDDTLECEKAVRGTTLAVTPGIALIIVVLSSLGLWGAIWAAIASAW